MNIEEIRIEDENYPIRLRNIKNPPKSIYVKGNKSILNQKTIAIVGSRDCTEAGAKNARLFSANIASNGFVVISGMAKGIDKEAHIRYIRSKTEKQ